MPSLSGLTLPKATLTVVDGVGVPPVLIFRYNPTEYTVSKSARWNRPPTRGAESSTPPEFTGSEPTTIGMEIFVDAFEELVGDVSGDIDTLLTWTRPTPRLDRSRPATAAPAALHLGPQSGAAGLPGLPQERAGASYTMFRRDGTPVRATATISLEEVTPEAAAQNPTSGARQGRSAHVVAEGESLQSIAYREYGLATLWRGLAHFNGIDDPMRLAPGTELLLPTQAEAARLDGDDGVSPGLATRPGHHRSTACPSTRVSCRSPSSSRWTTTCTSRTASRSSLSDPDGESLTKSRARIGSAVRISGVAMGESSESLLIHGEVTALEGAYTQGARVIIRGYDHSHRLVGLDRTETYRDVTDSDIARTIAQRAGVAVGTVEESAVTNEHVSQLDQPDWDFLKARARLIDFEVGVVDGKLDFKQRPLASSAPMPGDLTQVQPLQLVWGTNLQEFYPRVTAAEQVREVEVRGWDPISKEAIVATASAATTAVEVEDKPADLAAVYGRERWVGTASPVPLAGSGG